MKVLILHSPVPPGADPDELDTLVEAASVADALGKQGHDVEVMPCTLNLEDLSALIDAKRPDLIFNLVETLGGTGRLIHMVPSLVAHMGIPMTGASADALFLTSNKHLGRRLLGLSGVRVPDAVGEVDLRRGASIPGGRMIVKSVWEHASVGLGDSSVITPSSARELLDELEKRKKDLGGSCFAESYVEGREFNLSVIEIDGKPVVLPPAEIVFVDFPEGKPRMVGYRAKWDTESFEYSHTVRSFSFGPEDKTLLDHLSRVALRCFEIFELTGYARVDFRVDTDGMPWVLEVNANPCVSPDSGFCAAAGQAGMDYSRLIEQIIGAALRKPEALRERRAKGGSSTAPKGEGKVVFRQRLVPEDRERISAIVGMTGFFSTEEEATAVELVDDHLARGEAGGYSFMLAQVDGELAGYACYGRIPGSLGGFDLYWIAVDPAFQGHGVGAALLGKVAGLVRESGGLRMYADTSSRPLYRKTRRFYENHGFNLVARLEQFYGHGDDKLIYELELTKV